MILNFLHLFVSLKNKSFWKIFHTIARVGNRGMNILGANGSSPGWKQVLVVREIRCSYHLKCKKQFEHKIYAQKIIPSIKYMHIKVECKET
jgi:hypothetical protein